MWLCCCDASCPVSAATSPYSESIWTDLSDWTSSYFTTPSAQNPDFHESSGRYRCASRSDPYDGSEDDGASWICGDKPSGSGWVISVKAKCYVLDLTSEGATGDTSTVGVYLHPGVALFARNGSSPHAYGYRETVNDSADITTGSDPGFTTVTSSYTTGDELEVVATENGGEIDYNFKVNGSSIDTYTTTGGDPFISSTFVAGVRVTDSAEWDDFVVTITNGT